MTTTCLCYLQQCLCILKSNFFPFFFVHHPRISELLHEGSAIFIVCPRVVDRILSVPIGAVSEQTQAVIGTLMKWVTYHDPVRSCYAPQCRERMQGEESTSRHPDILRVSLTHGESVWLGEPQGVLRSIQHVWYCLSL